MLHIDTGEITEYDKLPNGTLRVVGTVAKTGWLKYGYFDPKTRTTKEEWELVTPEVLFSDTHLDSLKGTSITLDHPSEKLINPSSWKQYAIGMSSSELLINKDKGEIATISFIGDEKGIKAIKDGARYLSEGYIAPTKIIKNDSTRLVQLSRTANHYCLCKDSIPRAGEGTRLHLDSEIPIAYQIDWDEASSKQIFDLKPKNKEVKQPWQILTLTV